VASIPLELQRKEADLEEALRAAGRLIVAFSGGVDSSYLAFAAHRALAGGALAVTADSPSYPERHREMAEQVVEQIGIRHRFVTTAEMEREGYRANRSDRCYFCKTELFEVLGRLREELGFDSVAYGLNADDRHDFRPGQRAEQHEKPRHSSPYSLEAEIRALAGGGLPSAELPVVGFCLRACRTARASRPSVCVRSMKERSGCARSASDRCGSAITDRSRGSRSIRPSCRARSIPKWRGASLPWSSSSASAGSLSISTATARAR
jgi:hypothetical protein